MLMKKISVLDAFWKSFFLSVSLSSSLRLSLALFSLYIMIVDNSLSKKLSYDDLNTWRLVKKEPKRLKNIRKDDFV